MPYFSFGSTKTDDTKIQAGNTNSSIITNRYSDKLKEWQNEGISGDHHHFITINPASFLINDTNYLTEETNDYHVFLEESVNPSNESVLSFVENVDSYITFIAEVPKTSLYEISIDYYNKTDSIKDIEFAIKVNNETLYYESSQLRLDTLWYSDEEIQLDRHGNDIMPISKKLNTWNNMKLLDSSRIEENPLLFKLNEGINEISIINISGDYLLGNVYLSPITNYISYSDYLETNNYLETINTSPILIEAENLSYKTNLSISYGTNKNPSVKPFSLMENRLNIVDGATYKRSGDTIYYDVDIKESGFYKLTFKALQNKTNQTVFRTILINGEIPFSEARVIPFYYHSKWQNHTISDINQNELLFYLNEGINEIGLRVNSSLFKDIYQTINNVMTKINEITLDIKKLTGNNLDENIEWDIVDYMPNLKADLESYAAILEDCYYEYQAINKAKKQSEVLSALKFSYQGLYEISKNPNKVPSKLSRLSTGSNSILRKLGLILPTVIESPLTLDCFYLHGENPSLPRANASFFNNLWINIKRFFKSFFVNQYKGSNNGDELQIWVNRSRQYVSTMQQMIDNEFTEDTGIKVKISIMPNEDKLILAASANKQPDIAMGVAGWRPYDFAIRDAIIDLRTFPDFNEVAKRFHVGSLLQLVYQDGIYGLPETQNFYLLFYRKDIFDSLNLDVPNTWDDVISILPELQRYGLNFYSPLSNTSSFKGFAQTMPFILQRGGKLYSDDALSANLDNQNTINAINFMSELYTIYSLPLEVGSFYNEFRYGNIPIGIGDFNMYVQLVNAALEILGLWDIAPIPGNYLNGSIDRSYEGASTSMMVFKNTNLKDEAWEFIKWWTRDDVQTRYSNYLISAFGSEYMWNTANVNAFSELAIDKNHIQVFLEQWQFIHDTIKTPASYMLEREISNIWNKAVYNGINVRTAIEDSSIIVNKEIIRKMIEFGFINERNEVIKPCILPTKELVLEWLEDD